MAFGTAPNVNVMLALLGAHVAGDDDDGFLQMQETCAVMAKETKDKGTRKESVKMQSTHICPKRNQKIKLLPFITEFCISNMQAEMHGGKAERSGAGKHY